jgi:hypothetical protein
VLGWSMWPARRRQLTDDRDFKRLVRQRTAETGESYAQARRALRDQTDGMADGGLGHRPSGGGRKRDESRPPVAFRAWDLTAIPPMWIDPSEWGRLSQEEIVALGQVIGPARKRLLDELRNAGVDLIGLGGYGPPGVLNPTIVVAEKDREATADTCRRVGYNLGDWREVLVTRVGYPTEYHERFRALEAAGTTSTRAYLLLEKTTARVLVADDVVALRKAWSSIKVGPPSWPEARAAWAVTFLVPTGNASDIPDRIIPELYRANVRVEGVNMGFSGGAAIVNLVVDRGDDTTTREVCEQLGYRVRSERDVLVVDVGHENSDDVRTGRLERSIETAGATLTGQYDLTSQELLAVLIGDDLGVLERAWQRTSRVTEQQAIDPINSTDLESTESPTGARVHTEDAGGSTELRNPGPGRGSALRLAPPHASDDTPFIAWELIVTPPVLVGDQLLDLRAEWGGLQRELRVAGVTLFGLGGRVTDAEAYNRNRSGRVHFVVVRDRDRKLTTDVCRRLGYGIEGWHEVLVVSLDDFRDLPERLQRLADAGIDITLQDTLQPTTQLLALHADDLPAVRDAWLDRWHGASELTGAAAALVGRDIATAWTLMFLTHDWSGVYDRLSRELRRVGVAITGVTGGGSGSGTTLVEVVVQERDRRLARDVIHRLEYHVDLEREVLLVEVNEDEGPAADEVLMSLQVAGVHVRRTAFLHYRRLVALAAADLHAVREAWTRTIQA